MGGCTFWIPACRTPSPACSCTRRRRARWGRGVWAGLGSRPSIQPANLHVLGHGGANAAVGAGGRLLGQLPMSGDGLTVAPWPLPPLLPIPLPAGPVRACQPSGQQPCHHSWQRLHRPRARHPPAHLGWEAGGHPYRTLAAGVIAARALAACCPRCPLPIPQPWSAGRLPACLPAGNTADSKGKAAVGSASGAEPAELAVLQHD